MKRSKEIFFENRQRELTTEKQKENERIRIISRTGRKW